MERYREPVAVLRSENGRHDVVFCNDGSIWEFDWGTKRWTEMETPLPGSLAAAGMKPPYGEPDHG